MKKRAANQTGGVSGSRGVSFSLAPGLWKLTASSAQLDLDINCYLVGADGAFCLIETGPVGLADELLSTAASVTPVETIRAVVILDESPLAWSAVGAWRDAGFGGDIFADRGTAAALEHCGVRPVVPIGESETVLFPGEAFEMAVFRFERPEGAIALFHAPSGAFFSGAFGASLGFGLPALVSDGDLSAQRRFAAFHGGPLPPRGSPPPRGVQFLCPRFGSVLTAALSGRLAETGQEPEAACVDMSYSIEGLAREIATLKSSNYELRESMIGASDSALRDGASGLYGRGYADAFLNSLIQKKNSFYAAFVRLDGIKELNRRVGTAAVDLLMKDLAEFLQETEREAFFFRWTGPVILAILEGEKKDIFDRFERVRATVAKEQRFITPITVSIALTGSDELGESGFAGLQSLARDRLKLLERRGGDAILDRSDIRIEDRSLVLVLDSDPLFLDFCVEYFEREGFRPMGAPNGTNAFELMDRARPELVIADLSLPQYDAFQIRERMRASEDLHDIPFILLCSSKSDGTIARAHALSIFHIFEKPVSMIELVGIARNILSRSEDGA